ncbi:hypothetical protein A134_23150 [Vibrio crassostreae 9CS106]|uniref:Uncharacterized protein n=1 Tax=Vibrio crassostreae 9CS106 TaxID=1191300 RepID=A0A1B1C390_9VIBR|nr:hypothetical protein A134_23150 [Vibrio crassostreae 9CS106]
MAYDGESDGGTGISGDPYVIRTRNQAIDFVTQYFAQRKCDSQHFKIVDSHDFGGLVIPVTAGRNELKNSTIRGEGNHLAGFRLKPSGSNANEIFYRFTLVNWYDITLDLVNDNHFETGTQGNFIGGYGHGLLCENSRLNYYETVKTMSARSGNGIRINKCLLDNGSIAMYQDNGTINGANNFYNPSYRYSSSSGKDIESFDDPYDPENYTILPDDKWTKNGYSLPFTKPADSEIYVAAGVTTVDGLPKGRTVGINNAQWELLLKVESDPINGKFDVAFFGTGSRVYLIAYDSIGSPPFTSHTYAIGDRITPDENNGFAYECKVAGVSSDTVPPPPWDTKADLTWGTAVFEPKKLDIPVVAGHYAVQKLKPIVPPVPPVPPAPPVPPKQGVS